MSDRVSQFSARCWARRYVLIPAFAVFSFLVCSFIVLAAAPTRSDAPAWTKSLPDHLFASGLEDGEVLGYVAFVPPNPAAVAPALSPTEATPFKDATRFLYASTNPVQRGIAGDPFDLRRAATIRGRLLDRDGAPLPGALVRVLDHGEFGYTFSRADGWYDLVVNGGDYLVICFDKSGYLPAQRRIRPLWNDYHHVDDAVLLQRDAQATGVDFGAAATAMQIARGSAQNDDEGARRATLLFPAGVLAEVVDADGSTRPIARLTVRMTEYSVGEAGPQAMPGDLPPSSGYTYAVEYDVDEAPGKEIRFSAPIAGYVENFLDFPVGSIVPAGYYDRVRAAWVPSDNGRIIKVIGIADGMAALDIDGDDAADSATALDAIGIVEAERQRLAGLYAAGQSLWRVPITHFTPWDYNWPFSPPPDAEPPQGEPITTPKEPEPDCQQGSIIECQNQTLGETVALAGTAFALHYRSDRVPGRQSAIDIPLSGATLPPGVQRIELRVITAGRLFERQFSALPNLRHTFVWDGRNVHGQFVQGSILAQVSVGYVYRGVYGLPRDITQTFSSTAAFPITGSRTREEVVLWHDSSVRLGIFRGPVGGWSISPHHGYDPVAKTLYLGGGSIRDADTLAGTTITTIAGDGSSGFSGDGGPAGEAQLSNRSRIAVAGDGTLYIADQWNHRIRRVTNDGIITTVAGNGSAGFSGDGGPATSASLNYPTSVAPAPNGGFYIADSQNHRIRYVDANGTITTIAGNGTRGYLGERPPATATALNEPYDVVLAPDGTLYFSDYGNMMVRSIAPNGRTRVIAGGGRGLTTSIGDGGPGHLSVLSGPQGLALSGDGLLYIADAVANRIRRVRQDGRISTVAGTGNAGFSGDTDQATLANLNLPFDVAAADYGAFYIADMQNHRIRHVGADGVITTMAGDGLARFEGDHGPAKRASLQGPLDVATAPDQSVYIADTYNNRVRRVASVFSGVTLDEIAIAAKDGSEIYVFSGGGRHLRTLDSKTGLVLLRFGYDSAQRLASIADQHNSTTLIERDGRGDPTAIVSPFGRRTALTVNGRGYLASIADPAGGAYRMDYANTGLLTGFTDPNGNRSTISYDPMGLLTQDRNAANGSWDLTRTEQTEGWTVSLRSAENRTVRHQIEKLRSGEERRTNIATDGTASQLTIEPDGLRTSVAADGTIALTQSGPDPRFGMQAPITSSTTISLPSGLSRTTTFNSVVRLTDPHDPLSLASETNTATTNGRTTTSIYDAALRQYTLASPLNRRTQTITDALGRVIEMRTSALEPVTYQYDAHGRLVSSSQGTGPTARTVSMSYNAQGDLTTLVDSLGRTHAFAYDAVGRLTQQTAPGSLITASTYDANGNMLSLAPPSRPAHQFGYTPLNLQALYNPPAAGLVSAQTQYTYNLDGQPTRVTRPDGLLINFNYDASGRLSSLAAPTGATTYAYSGTTGQLITVANADATLSYTYDGFAPLAETWAGAVSGTVSTSYDAELRLSGVAANGSSIPYGYDDDGLLVRAGDLTLTRDAGNGFLTDTAIASISTTQSHNGFGEISRLQASQMATSLVDIQYTRDNAGRIVALNETIAGQTVALAYSYDAAGRLIGTTRNGTTSTYTYDANGNRLSHNATLGNYDQQDRLLTYGDTAYAYTANGELVSKTNGGGTTTYNYDVLGNLLNVQRPGGAARIDYLVDGLGRRIAKNVGGSRVQGFLYGGALKPIAELDASNAVVSRFVYATRVNVPDYMIRGGISYRILSDHLGSPRLVVNAATGAIAQRMDFDEFGNVLNDTNPGFQPFGFAGGLYDRDTGLIRYGARDYDPRIGRWTAKDPIGFAGGQANLYEYVGSDPVNFIDITGCDPVDTNSEFFRQLDDLASDLDESGADDFAAGFGDSIADGILGTSTLRGLTGTDESVDYCSDAYRNGKYTGIAFQSFATWTGGLNGGARSTFYAGHGASTTAETLGTTIAHTPIGSLLNQVGITKNKFVWSIASATFAANAKGSATAVIRYVGPNSIWRIERFILNARGIPIIYR